MIFTGVIVNFFSILAGTALGLLAGKLLTEKLRAAIMNAVALVVMGVAIPGLIETSHHPLVPILSLILGTVLGEALDLDRRMNVLGEKVQSRFKGSSVAEGFVTATMVFAVGAMAVNGSLNSGLRCDHAILISKSVIDGITAAAFAASSLGIGVALSAVPVAVIEGGIVLLASLLQPLLNDAVIGEMTFVGSLLILAIGFNMLGLTRLKVLNMTPGVLLPMVLCLIFK